jgi:hypothetical protein
MCVSGACALIDTGPDAGPEAGTGDTGTFTSCGNATDPPDDIMVSGSGDPVGDSSLVEITSASVDQVDTELVISTTFASTPVSVAPAGVSSIQYSVVLSNSDVPSPSDPELRMLVTSSGTGPLKLFSMSSGSDHIVIDGGASIVGSTVVMRVPSATLSPFTFNRVHVAGILDSPGRSAFDSLEIIYLCGP